MMTKDVNDGKEINIKVLNHSLLALQGKLSCLVSINPVKPNLMRLTRFIGEIFPLELK